MGFVLYAAAFIVAVAVGCSIVWRVRPGRGVTVATGGSAGARLPIRAAHAGGTATALVIGLLVLLSGSTVARADAQDAAFLVVGQDEVIHFVEWDVEGSEIAGSITVFTPSLDEPAGGTAEQHAVTGFIIGDSVALRFADGYVATGAIRDGDFILSWPDDAGGYYDVIYEPSGRPEYEARLRLHRDAAAEQAFRLEQARLLEEFATEIDDSLAAVARMSRSLAANRPSSASSKHALESMERAMEEATPAQIQEWKRTLGTEATLDKFGDEFGDPYKTFFCRSTRYAPDGDYANRLSEEVSSIEWALTALRHRIAWLEQTLAENPSIKTQRVDPQSARRHADEYEDDLEGVVADWRSEVDEAAIIRDAATGIVQTARTRFEEAGLTVPDCTPIPWAPGGESLLAGSPARAGQDGGAAAEGEG